METWKLTAGPFTALFEPSTGWLRKICLGETEVIRAIYFASRDESWGTPLPKCEIKAGNKSFDSFDIVMTSASPNGLTWITKIVGDSNGFIRYEAEAVAPNEIRTNRTGICVLHPAALSGRPCSVTHGSGEVEESCLPGPIAPYQPFFNIRSLSYSGLGTPEIELEFDGDTFEMEDQRNWSDASFKTYSGSVNNPYPCVLGAGERVVQSVHISVVKPAEPALGLILPPLRHALSAPNVEKIRSLHLNFVDAEIDLRSATLMNDVKQLQTISDALRLPFQLRILGFSAVSVLESVSRDLTALSLYRIHLPVCDDGHSPFKALETLRGATKTPIYASAAQYFTELNRNRPDMSRFDGVAFAMNPQVHAFDDRSIVESLETYSLLVQQAYTISEGKPVAVGPVTFEPRSWEARPPDLRLFAEFGRTWTKNALSALANANPESIAIHYTHGPRGVIESPEMLAFFREETHALFV